MGVERKRLYFVDAIRAWAILMMLQGHFIQSLLHPIFKDPSNPVFQIWSYFRGMTAPVFFTVSGFIFTFLLLKPQMDAWQNPRVKKGIKRGLQLVLIGYLLRLNFWGLFQGHIYPGFFVVDVLHCLGFSILAIVGIYLLSFKVRRLKLSHLLLGITAVLFLFEPIYSKWTFSWLPNALANYFTKSNGSVFTLFPWLGYSTFGAFIAIMFQKYRDQKNLYPKAMAIMALSGLALMLGSSAVFEFLGSFLNINLFSQIKANNYLIIRLGDVLILFSIFMLLEKWLKGKTILKIGSSTLTIYVVHFIILYGSFIGFGLYRYFGNDLNPWFAIIGALAFVLICTSLSLGYKSHKPQIKLQINMAKNWLVEQAQLSIKAGNQIIRSLAPLVKYILQRIFLWGR